MTPIAPTLSLSSAAERTWDVTIIGAGPAGSLAALLLARAGHDVLLLDRSPFPRDKTCGCCLNPAGVRLLHDLNLSAVLSGAARLDRFLLRLPSRTLDIPLPASLALPRTIFDARLATAAINAGAHFLPSTAAILHPSDDLTPLRELTLHSAGTTAVIHTRLILAADGLRGTALNAHPECAWQIASNSWFGISCTLDRALSDFPANTIAMHAAPHGYIGVIRLPGGQTHFAAALDPAECKRLGGPPELLATILHACHRPIPPELRHVSIHATPLLTRHRPCLGAHRILALGDAAAYVEPFTGEGMTWALQCAHLLSWLLPSSLEHWPSDLPARWTVLHHRSLAAHYRTCHLMRYLLHRPRLLNSAALLTRLLPPLTRLLVQRVSSPTAPAAPMIAGVST